MPRGYRKLPNSETFGVLFGRLVRAKRGIESLSQDGLAGEAGLTKARISDLETGKIANPHASTVDALCVALNISREERMECYAAAGASLPPRLLETLALRFGYDNPQAAETDLEAFLKNKAEEFRQMQARLAQITAVEAEVAELLTAANRALEEGDFDLADRRLAEAEGVQLATTTLVALERQCELRFARGQAALLAGDVATAVSHWEAAAKFFRYLARTTEAEKRFAYCDELRAYGYRYRSVPALKAAAAGLQANLQIWTRAASLRDWCRAMIALGGSNLRLAQFDHDAHYSAHLAAARAAYDAVRLACSEAVLPYYYAVSGGNLANVLSERKAAASDAEYVDNLERGLVFRLSGLGNLKVETWPEEWGIFQHNIGLSYIQLAQAAPDGGAKRDLIEHAVDHLEQSFEVRDAETELQYWIASVRSLGDALVEKALCQAGGDAAVTLRRAETLLAEGVSKISERDHPHQWAELQTQLSRCEAARDAIPKL
jgi:transcriptional regulator with XRE-family HTH domain